MAQKSYRGRTTCTVVYCQVCGKVVDKSVRNQKRTCSEICEIERNKQTYKIMYSRKVERDPDFHRKRNARHQFKIDTDPVLRAEYLQREKERYLNRKDDPNRRLSARRAVRKWSIKNKALVADYKKRYKEQHPEKFLEIQRKQAEKRSEWLAELKIIDPQAYEDYRSERREYERNLKSEKRLADLQKDMSKMENNDE